MAPLQVTESRGVKVYNVSSGKTLPQWLSEKKKKALRKDEEYKSRIELIQDLEFDVASSRIRLSPDGKFIAATGVYPPQVKVYELSELSMKFERHMDCETVQFEILSDDYSKMVFLQADRTVEFHAKFGTYYKTRIPKVGRDMLYDPINCDLVLVGSSNEAYRLNLEQGRFLKPLTLLADAANCTERSHVHGLYSIGTEAGTVECWDPREKSRIGITDVGDALTKQSGVNWDPSASDVQVTALKYHPDGLHLAAGTSNGFTLLYDLRSSRPLMVKDQQYGQAIVDIKFHQTAEGSYLLSADKTIVKVWDHNKASGGLFASIEPPADINEITIFPSSGLLVMATEQPRLHIYFVPALGPSPKWASFLDSLTEELEETARSEIYEDYRFVTREELEQLGLTGLVGTNMLKAYMHGFFIDAQLYARSKSVLKPFAYDEYRKQKIKDKIESKEKERIALKQPLPKVNKDLAEKILLQKEEEKERALVEAEQGLEPKDKKQERSAVKKKISAQAKLLEDDRFKAMFTQSSFEIDKESSEYQLLHPSESAADRRFEKRKAEEEEMEHFEAIDDLDSEEDEGGEDGDDDPAARAAASSGKVNMGSWGSTSTKSMRGQSKRKMFEVREGHEGAVLRGIKAQGEASVGGKKIRKMTMEERIKANGSESDHRRSVGGSMGNKEISFIPGDAAAEAKGGGGRPGERKGGRSMAGMLPRESSAS